MIVRKRENSVRFTGEQRGSVLLRAALLDSGGVELLGLLETVAFGVNLDDLCPPEAAADPLGALHRCDAGSGDHRQ
jgi:hypothetical protein